MTSEEHHLRQRRADGPINGRIGFFLGTVKQASPALAWLAFVFLMFGFQFTSPGQQIKALNERMATVERFTKALLVLECERVAVRDARLSQLPCAEVTR